MSRLAWHRAEALVHATARVERRLEGSWRHRGTAFFITEDLLLTCAHLVSGGAQTRVVMNCPRGAVPVPVSVIKREPDHADSDKHYPLPDVALLQLVKEEDCFHGSLPRLGMDAPGDDLLAYGYTDEYRRGEVGGHSCRFKLAGAEQPDPADPVIWRMGGDRIRPGMSGAPVLDLLTGTVVGMVKRTQDADQGVGGFFVPVSLILAAAPAAAAAAGPDDGEQLARQLWGNLFATTAAILTDSEGARSWLATWLGIQDLSGDGAMQASRLAAELFRLDLRTLGDVVQGLNQILDPPAPARLFDAVSTCTDFDGDQWIAADIAAELAAQVEQAAAAADLERGRVLDLQCRYPELREPYRRRGSRDNPWKSAIECGPFSHVTDPVTGLPAELEQDLRAAIVERFPNATSIRPFAEPELTDTSRRSWEEEWRPSLVGSLRRDRVLVMLPPGTALDEMLVSGLAAEYSLVFLGISDGNVSPELLTRDEYQVMQPQVNSQTAIRAFFSYDSTRDQLDKYSPGGKRD